MHEPHYQLDAETLAKLTPERRAVFNEWMARLDVEHARLGSPYGEGSLWETTGAECWLSWFEDGDEPADALREDLSCDSD